jgi:acyl transferase domain-containing protein
MRRIQGEFESHVKQIQLNKPAVPYISNVSGSWINADEAVNPRYWGDHLCTTVRFSDGIKELLKEKNTVFVEVGPGRVLSNMIRQQAGKNPCPKIVNLIRHQQEQIPDDYLLLRTLGQLWLLGVDIDWPAFYNGEKRNRIPLPAYPFEKRRYWFDAKRFNQLTQRLLESGEEESYEESQAPDSPDNEFEQENEYELFPGIVPNKYSEEYEAPRNELEKRLARMWQDVLGIKRISIHDNFFYLNGDSLTATQFISRVKDIYPVEISIEDFFEKPTIAHLAAKVKQLLIAEIKNLSPEEKKRLAGR